MTKMKTPTADRAARLDELKRAEAAARVAAARWSDDPNIRHLGYGRRVRAGAITDELVVVVFVKRKVTTDEELIILGSPRIPPDVDGVPTDVIESNLAPSSDSTIGTRGQRQFNPLVGGVSTANADNHNGFFGSYGTLGVLCWDATHLTPMALSNWHVWARDGEQGDAIIQPGHPTVGEYVQAGAELLYCGGPLLNHVFDWTPPSPTTWELAGGAAAAWLAAGLSDVADPIRRGRLATPPADPGERTISERVRVTLTPKVDPLPGTPFDVGVQWSYARETDADTYTRDVAEDRKNDHVLALKHLWTQSDTYYPGDGVDLFAEVVTAGEGGRPDYFVVAQVTPPGEQTKRSVVLRQLPAAEPVPHCISFECDGPGTGFGGNYTRGAVVVHAPPGVYNLVVDKHPAGGDGKSELVLYDGHAFTLPSVDSVTVELVLISGPVTIRAFAAGAVVGSATTAVPPLTGTSVTLTHASIDRIEVRGPKASALMTRLCYTRRPRGDERVTHYRGRITLDPRAPLGCYRGYVFVQTVNNVPPGTDPVIAAQTIGGLPASRNLGTEPAAGGGCALCIVVDHTFHVIAPPPPPQIH